MPGVIITIAQQKGGSGKTTVAAHLAVALETVLDHALPGATPLVVVAESGQRHPEVARWEHPELAAQPARRPTVVGDRHDGGQLGHHYLGDDR